ncbi:CRAL/TRIO domain-containing protein, partial [Neoconidiobolus thromboides FSU 785]
FINDPCLLRYLRANRWSLTNSLSGLKSTMNWRQEFAVTEMKPEEFYTEGATGKIYCNGYDNDNRPIIIMNPSAQNTNDSKAHIRFTVFSIETAIKMLPNDMEKLTIIIDLRNYALKHSVSLSEAKEVLTILSSHYPERLGRAFIVDAPWVFSGFFKIISPLMDPVTKDKIRFCNGKKIDDNHLSHFVPDWNLFKDFGGKSEYTFDSDKYFEQV